jgi:hypothetical protein
MRNFPVATRLWYEVASSTFAPNEGSIWQSCPIELEACMLPVTFPGLFLLGDGMQVRLEPIPQQNV